jgi:hypothetical protein
MLFFCSHQTKLQYLGIYTKYDIKRHMALNVKFLNKLTSVVMDIGWFHPLAKTLPSLVNNLW